MEEQQTGGSREERVLTSGMDSKGRNKNMKEYLSWLPDHHINSWNNSSSPNLKPGYAPNWSQTNNRINLCPQRLHSNSNKPYISAFKKMGYCGGQISLTWRCRRHVGASNFEFHALPSKQRTTVLYCCTFNRYNTSPSKEKLTEELICSSSDGTYRVPTCIEPSKCTFNNLMVVRCRRVTGRRYIQSLRHGTSHV